MERLTPEITSRQARSTPCYITIQRTKYICCGCLDDLGSVQKFGHLHFSFALLNLPVYALAGERLTAIYIHGISGNGSKILGDSAGDACVERRIDAGASKAQTPHRCRGIPC